MSVQFFLICKQLPPFPMRTSEELSYIEDTLDVAINIETETPEWLEWSQEERDSIAIILSFSGPASRLDWDLIQYFMEQLANATDGDIFDEEGELLYEGIGAKIAAKTDFDTWWQKRRERFEKKRQKKSEREQQRYLDLWEKYPEIMRQASDWSDVLPPEPK